MFKSKNTFIFDIEADGIEPTKIYCLVISTFYGGKYVQKTITDYDEMRRFFKKENSLFVGHNIIRWDVPVIERLLDLKVKSNLIDTLALSWYLYPSRVKHGLEDWGVTFGIEKPTITDWENQNLSDYIYRCQEDVKINCSLWEKIKKDILNLYNDSEISAVKCINYLMFKMDCSKMAEQLKWKLDVDMCKKYLQKLEKIKDSKILLLKTSMPKVKKTSIKKPPTSFYKKDGNLTSLAQDWILMLDKKGLPRSHKEPIEFVQSLSEPNPNSVTQIKDWLYSLGWIPAYFNYVKETKNGKIETRKVEQIRVILDGEKVLCESVKKLIYKEPSIEALEELGILTHRIGILKGFLKSVDKDGYIKAQISGFTNTLRFKHKTIVNLPSVNKPYGDMIRSVLTSPKGYELCGSDMSSLEDRTKRHYMWNYDKDYVLEMSEKGYDPHLSLAVFSGALTKEQSENHKNGTEDYTSIRHLYKTGNYSCTYGAGYETLSRSLNISKSDAKKIVDAYRDKNWSIDAISSDCETKICLNQDWLYNPVSKFWYSLRHKKDKFSTLNQGTGVYCFDIWIYNFIKDVPNLIGQMHDEVILCVEENKRDYYKSKLIDAINKTNDYLKLNVDLGVDIKFGKNYSQIH